MTDSVTWQFDETLYGPILAIALAIGWLTAWVYRDRLPRRAIVLSTCLRTAAVILMMLASAQPVLRSIKPAPLLVSFLLDVSDSITDRERREFIDRMNQVSAQLRKEDSYRLILFGRDAKEVLQGVGAHTFVEQGYGIDTTRTNLASALRTAVFGSDSRAVHRIVVLTDGNENVDQTAEALSLVRSTQARVFTIGPRHQRAEAFDRPYFDKVSVPQQVGSGERFYIHVFLENPSTTETSASLKIRFDGAVIAKHSLILPPGVNPFRLAWHSPKSGIHSVRAELSIGEDEPLVSSAAFVHVIGKPKVFLVDVDEKRRQFLAQLLSKDFQVESGGGLPGSYQDLLEYECLILNDVPAGIISLEKMDMITRLVQDAGMGLVVLGGDEESTLSSYRKTKLEDLLPVRLDIRSAKDRRDFALVMVIDRSGSMAGEKIEMARQSAIQAIKSLKLGDVVGVVAFDTQPYWIVPITTLDENRNEIIRQIKDLGQGGGTYAGVAMQEVFNELLKRQMNIRQHVVLISDGITEEDDFVPLVKDMADHGITVSTVAIGLAANQIFLQKLKNAGKGEFYHVKDIKTLPNIILEDIEDRLKAVNVIRSEFRPRVFEEHPIVKGIDPDGLPVLNSYSLSKLKPSAHKPLTTNFRNTEDPILATWMNGLGKVSVLLSGLRTGWHGTGTDWKQFGTLWSQFIRWTSRADSMDHALLRMTMHEDRLKLEIKAPLIEEDYPHSIRARLIGIEGNPREFGLIQKGLFDYESETTVPETREPALVIEGIRNNGPWVNAYPIHLPEPVLEKKKPVESPNVRPNLKLLKDIALQTNGAFEPEPMEILKRGERKESKREFWPLLAVLAMFAFLGDISVRRLWGSEG